MAVLHVTEENFQQEVIKSTIPVLVDFYAEWCGPCKMIAPILEQLADEMEGEIKIAKVNVDEAQNLASQFNVMSIPNMLLFQHGQVIEQMVGAMSKVQLLGRIQEKLEE